MTLFQQYQNEGIIRSGHFELSHGQHSAMYVDKDRLFRSKVFFNTILDLAKISVDIGIIKDLVITGPAIAGAVLAAPVWAELSYQYPKHNLSFVYPEKIDHSMVFRRGHDRFLKGKHVLIVEDVITTCTSVMQTVEAIQACGGFLHGVVCIWNRGYWSPRIYEYRSLITKSIDTWPAKSCPLCLLKQIPLTDPKV